MRWVILLGLAAGCVCAQNVQVYSEFAQIEDSGEVVAPENPREILSPAVARNAFSSFQLSIKVARGTKFAVYIGQNPENAVKITLYRRAALKLERVELPYLGDGSQVLWMDLWVDANAPVRRVKLEPQVNINGDWLTYPMEVRVMETMVPDKPGPGGGLADAFEVMHAYLCGTRFRPLWGRVPIGAELGFRNAQQDVALAAAGSVALREELKKVMGGCNAKPPADPEFYLRLRDYFFGPLFEKAR
jgi:hypothetical protein